MSVEVKLTSAEIINFYNSDEFVKDYQTEKGGHLISFNVKTRINDRSEKSPYTYKRCTIFARNGEEAQAAKDMIQPGNVLCVIGREERNKYEDKKTGETKYSDYVNVSEIVPIVTNDESANMNSDDDLPF